MPFSKYMFGKFFVRDEIAYVFNPYENEIEKTILGEYWEKPEELSIKNKLFYIVVSIQCMR